MASDRQRASRNYAQWDFHAEVAEGPGRAADRATPRPRPRPDPTPNDFGVGIHVGGAPGPVAVPRPPASPA
jgi:hypothetical protein